MPEVRYTLSDYQAMTMQDLVASERGAQEAVNKIEERIQELRQEGAKIQTAIAKRQAITMQGLSVQLGATVPRDGLNFGRDKDGRFYVAWLDGEEPEAGEPAPSPEPAPEPEGEAAKVEAPKKKRRRKTKAA